MANNINILPANHFSFTITKDVREICGPLFKYSGISLFIYGRFYDDGNCYILTSNEKLHGYLFEKEYILTSPVPSEYISNNFYYLIPSHAGPYQKVMHDVQNFFNLDHGFNFIERYQGYYDMFCFASTIHNLSIVNFYLNNIITLEKFKFYFKDKAKNIIKKSSENKILLPGHMHTNFGGVKLNTSSSNRRDKQNFLNHITPKYYFLSGKYEGLALTKREVDVLEQIASGLSIKEAARQMYISPRTVESYLNNIKYRLKIYKKSDLINLISNLRSFNE